MKILKKIKRVFFAFAILFFGINMQADAAYYMSNCNSPCENPCAPSRTICEGSRCTTYCNTSYVYDTSWNYTPNVTFSYSTPSVSLSISNEYLGLNVVKFNGRPAVHYHKSHPANYRKPIHSAHSVYRPSHVNSIKSAPNKPNKPIAQKPPQKPIYDRPVVKPKSVVQKNISKPILQKPASGKASVKSAKHG